MEAQHLKTSVQSVTQERVTPETSDVALFWGTATEKHITSHFIIHTGVGKKLIHLFRKDALN